jgi:hypothetical protein
VGQPVTIPTADTSQPAVLVDLLLPDHRTVSFATGAAQQIVTSAASGPVSILARAVDQQGAQDIEIWAGERRCETNGGTTTCSGPGLLAYPTSHNTDTGSAGAIGCTERLATADINISKVGNQSREQVVHLVGKNFGGQSTMLGFFTLSVQ